MSAPDIFLSYNREDAAIAKTYADAFAAAGLEVWWDVTLRSGEAYDQVTEEALDRSLALSPNSFLALRWKAVVAAELGKDQAARAAVSLIRETEPGQSTDDYLGSLMRLPVEHPRKYEAIAILRELLEETGGGV